MSHPAEAWLALALAAASVSGCAAHQAAALAPRLVARATAGQASDGSWRWSVQGGLEWRLARPEPRVEGERPPVLSPPREVVPCRSASICAWERASVAVARARLEEP